MKKVFLVSYYRFPEGDAGSVRQYALAKLFQKCGYSPLIISMGAAYEGIRIYRGVQYLSLRNKNKQLIGRVCNYLFFKKRLKKILKYAQKDSIILFSDIPNNAVRFLLREKKKKDYKLIYDCVEWYSEEQFKWGKLDLNYQKKDRLNSRIIGKEVNVIAISEYLTRYFREKGCKTILIPVIMDKAMYTGYEKKLHTSIQCIYAGSPGTKDYLNTIIEGFAKLNRKELCNIKLRIIGVREEEMIRICHVNPEQLEKVKDCLEIYGRLTREEVLEHYKESDFSILMRDGTLRYAKAGFPTKVVESLFCKTPIICNLSSDLGSYLLDKKNCMIVGECSGDALAHTLRKVIHLKREKRKEMSELSGKTAENKFEYHNYVQVFQSFLQNLI